MFPTNMAFQCHVCQTLLKTLMCKMLSINGYECFNFQKQTNSKYEQQLWISQFSNCGCPIGIGWTNTYIGTMVDPPQKTLF
jgi:hypothetical protein